MVQELFQKADLELIEEVKRGNIRSFSELVKRHQKGLFRLCLRFLKSTELAEDVVQETFIKAYEKLETFEGRSSFKSWLYQIGVNSAKNRLREFRYDMDDIENVHLAIGASLDQGLIHAALSDIIQKEVDELPQKQKMALTLRVYDDLSFKEIAHIMNCPYDTAKANYRHALMKLRHVFESSEELRAFMEESSSVLVHFNNLACEVE